MPDRIFAIDIVVPVYNEGANIEKTLDSIEKNLKNVDPLSAKFQIVIVYDFEEDNTLPVVKKIQSQYAFPIVFLLNPIRGVLNAIKTGLLKSKADYILITMADMSDDYSIFPDLVI
ncbi:MAG: glycosyltransferase [Candidatus Brocadiae bacterium]|nr:glycosyltransferase [Candidatus Brocadiia bacterium]